MAEDKVFRVMAIVGSRLPLRDLCALLLLSRSCYRALLSNPTLWEVLDLREKNKAGESLISALELVRYHNVKKIILEFSRDLEDEHLITLQKKGTKALHVLQSLNLNGCQKLSDKGIEAISTVCPNLKVISLYWIVRLSDLSREHIGRNCKHIININLSGCKSISDKGLSVIAANYKHLEELDITRCVKVTDGGLEQILVKCSALKTLNLYALSSLTDASYKKISHLAQLIFLHLCGAQNLSDEGLACIARCKNLVSLNLTWCIRVTDVGLAAIAEGCRSLEFLSLYGIVGVTDECLQTLSKFCSNTITTLDVNGCIGIKKRSHGDLLKLFPNLKCFKVHS